MPYYSVIGAILKEIDLCVKKSVAKGKVFGKSQEYSDATMVSQSNHEWQGTAHP